MWPRKKRRPVDPPSDAELQLVDECEAFLAGTLVERLSRTGSRIPMWAWTNMLAHATQDELERHLRINAQLVALPSEWQRARTYLAGEVLHLANVRGPLERVQTNVLVPLELQLSTMPRARFARPAEWVTFVLVGLAGYQVAPPGRLDIG